MRADWFLGSTSRMSRQMLSAWVGSFKSRYRSARSSAAGIAKALRRLSLNSVSSVLDISTPLCFCFKSPEETPDRVIEFVHHPFFERNDCVVCNFDAFRTDGGATLRDITVPDSLRFFQFLYTIFNVKRMHLECGDMNEESWADKLLI